jgi:two-component system nitrate/nitrite response regulator NarL
MATRTCLVGDRKLVRAGLRHILGSDAFEVVREISTLSECRGLERDWDLIVIDRPDDADNIDADIRQLKSIASDARLVVLAESMDVDEVAASFVAGVDGYLLADISPEALIESLRLVMLGEKVFPSRLVALLTSRHWAAHNPARPPANGDGVLSDREVAIVARLTGGMPNKVIASELTITEATVKVHLKSIMKKIGVTNRTQAAIWAINNGVAARTRLDS